MIPLGLTQSVRNLAADITATAPLTTASRLAINALQTRGAALLAAIDAALATAGAALDAPDPAGTGVEMFAALIAIEQASIDQSRLSDMRGLVGRAMFNLAQASS